MEVYNQLMGVPHDIITIPYMVHSMLAQVEDIVDNVKPEGVFFGKYGSYGDWDSGIGDSLRSNSKLGSFEKQKSDKLSQNSAPEKNSEKQSVQKSSVSFSRRRSTKNSNRRSSISTNPSKRSKRTEKKEDSLNLVSLVGSFEEVTTPRKSADFPLLIMYRDKLSVMNNNYNEMGEYVKTKSNDILHTCWDCLFERYYEHAETDLCHFFNGKILFTKEKKLVFYYLHLIFLKTLTEKRFAHKSGSFLEGTENFKDIRNEETGVKERSYSGSESYEKKIVSVDSSSLSNSLKRSFENLLSNVKGNIELIQCLSEVIFRKDDIEEEVINWVLEEVWKVIRNKKVYEEIDLKKVDCECRRVSFKCDVEIAEKSTETVNFETGSRGKNKSLNNENGDDYFSLPYHNNTPDNENHVVSGESYPLTGSLSKETYPTKNVQIPVTISDENEKGLENESDFFEEDFYQIGDDNFEDYNNLTGLEKSQKITDFRDMEITTFDGESENVRKNKVSCSQVIHQIVEENKMLIGGHIFPALKQSLNVETFKHFMDTYISYEGEVTNENNSTFISENTLQELNKTPIPDEQFLEEGKPSKENNIRVDSLLNTNKLGNFCDENVQFYEKKESDTISEFIIDSVLKKVYNTNNFGEYKSENMNSNGIDSNSSDWMKFKSFDETCDLSSNGTLWKSQKVTDFRRYLDKSMETVFEESVEKIGEKLINEEIIKKYIPDDYNYVEDYSKDVMPQVLQDAVFHFNSKEIRVCPVTNQLILFFYNDIDKPVFKECWMSTVRTKIGLRDFTRYTMKEESDWLNAKRKSVASKRSTLDPDLGLDDVENKEMDLLLFHCTDVHFISHRSIKYGKLESEALKLDEKESMVKTNKKTKLDKQINKDAKGSIEKMPQKIDKDEIKEKETKDNAGSLLSRKMTFRGYDLDFTSRFQFTGINKEIIFENDSKISYNLVKRLYGQVVSTVVVESSGHSVFYHESSDIELKSFHCLHSSGIILFFTNANLLKQFQISNEKLNFQSFSNNSDELNTQTEQLCVDFTPSFEFGMKLSLPSGLWLEKKCARNTMYIKQKYFDQSYKKTGEKYRCVLQNGAVIKFMESMSEILHPNSTRHVLLGTGDDEILDYDVILPNGKQLNYRNGIFEEETKFKTFSTTDIFNNSSRLKRADDSRVTHLSDGSIVADHHDGTRITTIVGIDDDELFCEWDADEYTKWFEPPRGQSGNDVSSYESRDSSSSMSNKLVFDITDEGYLVINLSYKIEHPDYVTVCYDRQNKISFNLPHGVDIELSNAGFTMKLDAKNKLNIYDERIVFEKINERVTEINLITNTHLCTSTDTFENKTTVDRDGRVNTTSGMEKPQLDFRCFVVNKDLSGFEFLNSQSVHQHLKKVNKKDGIVENFDAKNVQCILSGTHLENAADMWKMHLEEPVDTKIYNSISTYGDDWFYPFRKAVVKTKPNYSPKVVLVRSIDKLTCDNEIIRALLLYLLRHQQQGEHEVDINTDELETVRLTLDKHFISEIYAKYDLKYDSENDNDLNDVKLSIINRLLRRVAFTARKIKREKICENNKHHLRNAIMTPYFDSPAGQMFCVLSDVINNIAV
uniref:Uncharacterized protein n=1 Tax=Clastoptera arizonana TaxID=38151 RepID=A0A1B6DZI5_9HEMI